ILSHWPVVLMPRLLQGQWIASQNIFSQCLLERIAIRALHSWRSIRTATFLMTAHLKFIQKRLQKDLKLFFLSRVSHCYLTTTVKELSLMGLLPKWSILPMDIALMIAGYMMNVTCSNHKYFSGSLTTQPLKGICQDHLEYSMKLIARVMKK